MRDIQAFLSVSWHSLGLVDFYTFLYIVAQKAKNVVTLEVDNIIGNTGQTGAGIATTNTMDPLYIGGVPG